MKRICLIAVGALAVLIGPVVSPASAQTVEELKQRLAREQAKNAELLRRIELLEKEVNARRPAHAAPTDEAGTRALERALVRRGGVLLPAFQVEVEPTIGWQHSSPDTGYRIQNAYDGAL